MGNHSFFSGILDIRSSLLGVGLVCSVTSEGIESVIAQVGGGFVISINYSNLSFSCILADGGVLVLSVHCFVFHGEGAVVIADHASSDVLLGGVWFCGIAQILADFFRPYDGFSCGVCVLPYIGSGGDRAAVFIENGFCSVFHSANGFIDFGCHIALIDIGLVGRFASQGNTIRFEASSGELTFDYHIISCNGAGSGDIYRVGETAAGKGGYAVTDTGALYFTAFHAGSAIGDNTAADRTGSGDVFAGNIFAGNIAISMQIAGCGNIFTGNIAGACIDVSIVGQDFTAVRIYAAFGCNLTVCIDLKIPICPSNFTFRCIQGCFGSAIVIIASGVDTLFIHGSTVLAYFDSIFAEGNLVFAIFIQHQLIHRRGCGAVVSGDFGNHAVDAHFEIILGIGFPRIDFVNYFSITITGGFEGIVCFFGMVCFSGMGYVVDSNYICGLIIFCRRNHIARIANSDFSNIGRFTQYAASCE